MKAIGAVILVALGGLSLSEAAFAQAKDKAPNADRPLLATFCDAANIKGSACSRAKGYRSGKRCDVKLTPDRYSGKFLADGSTLLLVNYESGCEPHATNFGGSVIFEQKDGATIFGGYQPKIFGELGPGEAYVPPGHAKKARFVIDLTTSQVVPETEFGKR